MRRGCGAGRFPPCGVAKITFTIQDAGNIYRRVYADAVRSFTSWRALEAIAYSDRSIASRNRCTTPERFRHEMNHAPRIEPANIDDLPD
jgi:hypothetical protein